MRESHPSTREMAWIRLAEAKPGELTAPPRLGGTSAVNRSVYRRMVTATQPDPRWRTSESEGFAVPASRFIPEYVLGLLIRRRLLRATRTSQGPDLNFHAFVYALS